MKSIKHQYALLPAAFGFVILVLDTSTAIEGARKGIELCIQTVIPSLFPLIFLSSMISSSLLSTNSKGSRWLCRLFGIPQGTQGILLTGLVGGYPIGAKCIREAVHNGQLAVMDAGRMIVFCNASGPAFLFGMTAALFPNRWTSWLLWCVHLLSALCVARLLPSSSHSAVIKEQPTKILISKRLRQTVQTTGEICGWITLMRTVISFIQKWGLWLLPKEMRVLTIGMLELSNGCVFLSEIENTGLRFILCAVMIGFGGICVALQTESVAHGINQKLYLPGKVIQGIISFIVAYLFQYILFESNEKVRLPWLFLTALSVLILIVVYCRRKIKKSCGNLELISV